MAHREVALLFATVSGLLCTGDCIENGTLRLINDNWEESTDGEGELQVYLNGQWGVWCDPGGAIDQYGSTEGELACTLLGYREPEEVWRDRSLGMVDIYWLLTFLSGDMTCPTDATTLTECEGIPWFEFAGNATECNGVVQLVCEEPDTTDPRHVEPQCFSDVLTHRHVEGGTRQPDAATKVDCMLACRLRSECSAIDWSFEAVPYRNSSCWLHLQMVLESDIVLPYNNNNVSHFTRKAYGQCHD